MPKNRLRKYLPTPTQVREHPALRPVAHLLHDSDLWHMNRRTVSGAFFIGLFCAFLPIPMQMVVAAVLAIGTRCNLPLSVALVWISNPITFTPMFYFAYQLGAWLLGSQLEADSIELSFEWLWHNLASIGYPLIFGSLVCGWVAGVSGFVISRALWRFHVITRWRDRRERLRRRKKS